MSATSSRSTAPSLSRSRIWNASRMPRTCAGGRRPTASVAAADMAGPAPCGVAPGPRPPEPNTPADGTDVARAWPLGVRSAGSGGETRPPGGASAGSRFSPETVRDCASFEGVSGRVEV